MSLKYETLNATPFWKVGDELVATAHIGQSRPDARPQTRNSTPYNLNPKPSQVGDELVKPGHKNPAHLVEAGHAAPVRKP